MKRLRRFLAEEGKIGHLQSHGKEGSDTCQIEELHEPDPSLMMRRGDDHGFAHKPAEQGKSRNRDGAHNIKDHGERHVLV